MTVQGTAVQGVHEAHPRCATCLRSVEATDECKRGERLAMTLVDVPCSMRLRQACERFGTRRGCSALLWHSGINSRGLLQEAWANAMGKKMTMTLADHQARAPALRTTPRRARGGGQQRGQSAPWGHRERPARKLRNSESALRGLESGNMLVSRDPVIRVNCSASEQWKN